ncbi:MAG: DUF72 domain-containing protein [Planctomycetota bacterium]|jgi:uncharacterized protein YecE (DUF72 family)
MTTIRAGTCGFRTRPQEYFGDFGVVEIQQSLYHPPRLATAQRWRTEAPEGFEFTLEAFQAITHSPTSLTRGRSRLNDAERAKCGGFRDTPVVRKAWKTTLELARTLDATFVIFQCPASFRPTDENIDRLWKFFEWAHRDRLRFGWDPRGDAWTDDLVRRVCVELSLTHVVDPFTRKTMRGRPPYYRLHGISGHGHRYTDDELSRLRGMCSEKITYCMFNNASQADDARRFLELTGHAPPADRRSQSRMPP